MYHVMSRGDQRDDIFLKPLNHTQTADPEGTGQRAEGRGRREGGREIRNQKSESRVRSPANGDRQFFAEAIVVMKLAILDAVFVDEFGELHIVTAILGDFEHFALPEPVNGLQPFGGLFVAGVTH
jgi:hypothetical protein